MGVSLDKELAGLLKDVSRSFYLTLRVLPGRIRPQIGLAYLLARTTDTIADTGLVPLEQRLGGLKALQDRIAGRGNAPLEFKQLAEKQASAAERRLLERAEEIVGFLSRFGAADRERIRQVLETITGGQELDLRRFATATEKQITPLETEAELDDYTYRVAGCVGEFWTHICRAHLFPGAALDEVRLLAEGVRFGKGLQLVNILRDLPGDLRQGRCYLPRERLEPLGLRPTDLLDPANEARLRPLYNRYLELAQNHLAAGWHYTNTLPWSCFRVRLACAWPVLIGLETLRPLRTRNLLDPAQRIKISRPMVRGILWRTVLLYPFPGAWEGQAQPLLSGGQSSNTGH